MICVIIVYHPDKIGNCMSKKAIIFIGQGYQTNEPYRRAATHQCAAIATKLPGHSEPMAVLHPFTSKKSLLRLCKKNESGAIEYISHREDSFIIREYSNSLKLGASELNNTVACIKKLAPDALRRINGLQSLGEYNLTLNNLGIISNFANRKGQYITNAQPLNTRDLIELICSDTYKQLHDPSLKFSLRHPQKGYGVNDRLVLATTEGPILNPSNTIEIYCDCINRLMKLNSVNEYLDHSYREHYKFLLDYIAVGDVKYCVYLNDCSN
jgi:hypothetical protein